MAKDYKRSQFIYLFNGHITKEKNDKKASEKKLAQIKSFIGPFKLSIS